MDCVVYDNSQESLSLQESLRLQLENAENQIRQLLQINSELTARCEFLQQNFNGNYNELLIEYQTLNRVFLMSEKKYQEMLKKYK
jgi:hypothetical protein